MAITRQNVSKPRFYIDHLQYLNTRGVGYDFRTDIIGAFHVKGKPAPGTTTWSPEYMSEKDESTLMQCWGINPLSRLEIVYDTTSNKPEIVMSRIFTDIGNQYDNGDDFKQWILNSNYICLFGHNFGTQKLAFTLRMRYNSRIFPDNYVYGYAFGDNTSTETHDLTDVLNARRKQDLSTGTRWIVPKNDGVSMLLFDCKLWPHRTDPDYKAGALELVIAKFDDVEEEAELIHISDHFTEIGDNRPIYSSLSVGRYFDFDAGSDLNLKINKSFQTRQVKTAGGYTHSTYDHKHTKNPFEVFYPYDNDPYISNIYSEDDSPDRPIYTEAAWKKIANAYSRKGNRVWDLTFSQLDDSFLMPVTESDFKKIDTTSDLTEGTDYEDIAEAGDFALSSVNPDGLYWADHTTDFYSRVVHMTLGGQLPFIFQLDSSDFNPDKFAVVVFDQDKFTYEQFAHNIYNISLKIRETW